MWDIIQVIPTDDYKVYLYFEDGKIKLFDVKVLMDRIPFKKLKDKNVFKDTCTVLNGNLSWSLDKSYNKRTLIYVDSLKLYSECEEVVEPIHLFKNIKPNSVCPKCGSKFDGYYCFSCGYWIEELDVF